MHFRFDRIHVDLAMNLVKTGIGEGQLGIFEFLNQGRTDFKNVIIIHLLGICNAQFF